MRYFYPRSPCGERLRGQRPSWGECLFLSTLSLRRATWPGLLARPFFIISIHALLAESDQYFFNTFSAIFDFYPRSPCGERPSKRYPVILGRGISIHALLAESDNILCAVSVQVGGFLSTLSLRRATLHPKYPKGYRWQFLSTLSLRRATQANQTCREEISISIHALLAESDNQPGKPTKLAGRFLSTLSLRRAT